MRKSAVIIPLFALIAGIIGFVIRQMEVSTGFEATTGFAKRGFAATTNLIIVSAVVILLAAAIGILAKVRMKADNDYKRTFAPKGFLYLAVSFVLGFAWLAADVLYLLDLYGKGAVSVLDIIFVFLAAASALSVIFLARGAYKGRGGGEMLLFSVIPSVFFCFWLIVLYKNNASNPVILRFSYECLAIAAAALSYYFSAGFVFGKSVTGRTLFSFLVTIYFCLVVLADSVGIPIKIIFGLTAVNAFVNTVVYLRNLRPKEAL